MACRACQGRLRAEPNGAHLYAVARSGDAYGDDDAPPDDRDRTAAGVENADARAALIRYACARHGNPTSRSDTTRFDASFDGRSVRNEPGSDGGARCNAPCCERDATSSGDHRRAGDTWSRGAVRDSNCDVCGAWAGGEPDPYGSGGPAHRAAVDACCGGNGYQFRRILPVADRGAGAGGAGRAAAGVAGPAEQKAVRGQR